MLTLFQLESGNKWQQHRATPSVADDGSFTENREVCRPNNAGYLDDIEAQSGGRACGRAVDRIWVLRKSGRQTSVTTVKLAWFFVRNNNF
jgi:hypothetical protein